MDISRLYRTVCYAKPELRYIEAFLQNMCVVNLC
jgi:hypothetical protein